MSIEIKKGDWCIYGLDIVQVMELEPYVEYSTGHIRGSNAPIEHFRPLTLQSKVIVEGMDHYYQMLRDQDGSAGFNFPRISQYFAQLALDAIDGTEDQAKAAWKRAQDFVHAARDYQQVIDGIRLFRPR
jgi:hypothetical protein